MEDCPHINASSVSFFDGFRATMYLLTPAESSYERMSDVPNYVVAATPHFFILILLEMLIQYLKGQELRINDKVTCVGAGMYSEIIGLMGLKGIEFYLYVKVYNNFCIYQLPWDSAWTWIFMALVYDLLYYWFHRMAHEVNILWKTHQTHHSSEDYALTTALRQSATQTYLASFVYLPAALLVPPSVFIVHKQLNLLYQFWIHTELVESLGPLEYILNTPSHHRVHHGRNPYCIDKNYAAVLIIWDRMFGTFEPERKDEKVVYGLVHPVNTFDSNAIQVSHYIDFFKHLWNIKGSGNKLRFIFYGPGWAPGTPRLGNPEDIPKVEHPAKVYNPCVSNWLNFYVMLHFLVATMVYNVASFYHLRLPTATVLASCFFIFASLTCFGYLFDKRSFAPAAEFLRCVITSSVLFRYRSVIAEHVEVNESLLMPLFAIFGLSALMWLVVVINIPPRKEKSS